MKHWIILLLLFLLAGLLAACGGDDTQSDAPRTGEESSEQQANKEETDQSGGTANMVNVTLMNGDEDEVGTAELIDQEDGVLFNVEASDLPEGEHGFHVHEAALCKAPEFKSAGDHFNPTDASHGTESEDGPHAGDLPNLEVGEDGTVQKEFTAENVTLEKEADNSLLAEDGTALVIHAKADDHASQPSGDAGARIACGEITEQED
ncbi:superoxide dismutase family protein [Halobacillus sp. Marseille-Q1614]|uniref:superoxide dismutase family protein n=1 Tax=Halobacillus sp. Marseille-Q1614 TaxID=2709134 RepID=UPI00156F1041|nr:superoxide dismutase family protein [Halobacillus sp. Marseille-Q1614]